MDIVQIVFFGITAALVYVIVKEIQPNAAFILVLVASIIIFFQLIEQIRTVILFIESLAVRAAVDSYYLATILKIIGIAYIVEISANLTKDSGLTSLAAKIELAGKIFILLLALPIIQAVIEVIIQFIPTGTN
ncbi:MAG: stage III sporulation protein AD [Bacilli bacterium]|nr:stage III sporulation protein AD [Bacilli bacterium]